MIILLKFIFFNFLSNYLYMASLETSTHNNMELFTEKYIIPKGTILCSYSIPLEISDNKYYSYWFDRNKSFKDLYNIYYNAFSSKCYLRISKILNIYIVIEDMILLKLPDNGYELECETDLETMKKIFEFIINEKYYKSKLDFDKYNNYFMTIFIEFYDKTSYCDLSIFNDNPLFLKIKNIDSLNSEERNIINDNIKIIRNEIYTSYDILIDYEMDYIFNYFNLNGWIRINRGLFSKSNELLVTNSSGYNGNNIKRIATYNNCEETNLKNLFETLTEDNEYMTYYNITFDDFIFNINKPQPIFSPFSLTSSKQKYLKYKNKYIYLKNKIKIEK